ncbi:hypothetical protein TD95_004866 [Thielaviopsis punctulata]|uniref:Probable beta-glucosidase btgE n=1 Tax=Thielaviopsis punctulata TaxID=72032 RepID=A0A0F4ZKW0_9PEZI|nr:hypothetical protein TD95_004866 [Thielaviopsis punctulata]
MKGAFVAAFAGLASAGSAHRRAHQQVKAERAPAPAEECGCTTVYTTWYGEPTLHNPPPVAFANTTSAPVVVAEVTPSSVEVTPTPAVTTSDVITTSSSTPVVVHTTTAPATVPTPAVETCATPGVYTFPATTIVVTETTTVCGATTTVLPSGSHTFGGVTTTVTKPTTVTCAVPVETTGTDSAVTSIVSSTVYVCPSAGTYTINPKTTSLTTEKTVVYPTVTSFLPGTYSKDMVVVTATVDEYVTVCPFVGGPYTTSLTTEGVSAEASTSTSAPVPAATTSKAVVVSSSAKPSTTSKPASSAPASKPASSASASSAFTSSAFTSSAFTSSASASKTSSASTSSSTGVLFQGQQSDHWAITYTPYTDDTGACKSKSAVYEDIKNIKSMGFTTVRVYSTDCDTLTNVGGACEEYGIRMIIGVFIKEAGCAYSGDIKEQVEGIISWGKFDMVDMLVVGNEAVFGGLCSASQLATLITTVKSTCDAAGYTGPYSTAETVNVWQESGSALCDVVDIAGAQTHPYFNAETTPSTSGSFVKGQIDIVKKVCNKPAISLECGWPTEGSCNGSACPGVSEQKEAMDSVRSTCGEEVVFFTYGEALWKSPGSCGCEPYFNIMAVFESS